MLKYGYVYETHAEAAVIESEREGIYVGIKNGFIKKIGVIVNLSFDKICRWLQPASGYVTWICYLTVAIMMILHHIVTNISRMLH